MTASVPPPQRRADRPGRRWRAASAVLATSAATTIGVAALAAAPAAAEIRDPCSDAANKARVDLDIAHGWWAMGMALDNAGYYDAADDAFAAMDYFMAAYEVHVGDAERC